MIRFEDKMVTTATHEIPYGVAVAKWFMKVEIHRQ